MAKKRFFFGTLAMVLALVFGLVLAGCKTDDDGGGGGGGYAVTLKNTTGATVSVGATTRSAIIGEINGRDGSWSGGVVTYNGSAITDSQN